MSDPQSPPSASPGSMAPEDRAFNFLDLLEVIVRRRRLILWTTSIAALLVVTYNIAAMSMNPESPWNRLPNRYTATAKVIVSEERENYGSAAANALSRIQDSGGLSAIAGVFGAGSSTNAAIAKMLLTTRSVLDPLAKQQGFITPETSDPNEVLNARNRLQGSISAEFFIDSNVLQISYEHLFPEEATSGLSFVIDLLREKVHALMIEQVVRKKAFLEERLAAVSQDRSHAQEALIAFQRQYGVVNLDVQSQQMVQDLALIKTDLYEKEVEILSRMETFGKNHASVVRLRNEVEKLRMLISEFQTGFVEFSDSAIPLQELPGLSVRHLDLVTELTVHNSIYSFLRSEYESTRIDESSHAGSFQIIEPVEIPLAKSGPSRSRICITVTIAAFLAATLLAFILEYLKRITSDPERRRQIDAILAEIGLR